MSAMTDQLLRALLLEIRALRRSVERRRKVPPSLRHESLLAGIHAVVGEDAWTCNVLVEMAHADGDLGAAKLLAALEELEISRPFALGTYLRSRIGQAANGLELRRLGLGPNKVARWSVLAP